MLQNHYICIYVSISFREINTIPKHFNLLIKKGAHLESP